jgi:hypothetical protein
VKRRYVVVAVVASSAILAGAVVGILTYDEPPTIVTAASEPEPEPTPKPEPGVVYDVPDWIRERVEGGWPMGHADGEVEEVYGAATTTFANWHQLEPGYAMAQEKVTEKNRDDPVYAVFVRGRWSVGGIYHPVEGDAPQQPIEDHFVSGRVLFDKDGTELLVQLWEEEKPARPAFGEPFAD